VANAGEIREVGATGGFALRPGTRTPEIILRAASAPDPGEELPREIEILHYRYIN
jgi:hypothetical protein